MDKVLVIDDSQLYAEALKNLLKDEYDVSVLSVPEDAVSQVRSGGYSLVLLDVVMPRIDGFTLLKELQENAETMYIPVIMITSLSATEHEEKGLMLGAVDYITKPFSPIIVKARVKTHIKLYHYRMQFRQEAMLDELTGIANRRGYDHESFRKWHDAIRFKLSFSLCILDIDKFKLYNDTYGHPAGDKVIAAVAESISSHLKRSSDFFARYGGEEFVVILVGNSARSAYEFMMKVRKDVEDMHIPHNSPVSPWVPISAGGITVVPKEGEEYDGYLKLADQMLYNAKEYGRNRVVWSNEKGEQWREK